MKNLLLLVFGLVCFTNCKAQRISYNDLIFLLNNNVAVSENFLSKKGFEFSKVDTTVDQPITVKYSFTKNPFRDKSYMSITKSSVKEIFHGVSFYTVFQSDYSDIKASILQNGYKLQKTTTDNGSLIFLYKKGVIEVEFVLTRIKEKDITDYYITFTNTVKEKAGWDLLIK